MTDQNCNVIHHEKTREELVAEIGILRQKLEDAEDRAPMQEPDSLAREHEELKSMFQSVERAKKEWEKTMDCITDMIILTDREGKIIRGNMELQKFTGTPIQDIKGKEWEALLNECALEIVTFYAGSIELYQRPSERWFSLVTHPYHDEGLGLEGNVLSIHETTEFKVISNRLEEINRELKTAQSQMLQKEKMASIGQLAAGVAHEINNPMGFITSNLNTLGKYFRKASKYISILEQAVSSLEAPQVSRALTEVRRKLNIDFIFDDFPELIHESRHGTERVQTIVQNLKIFSRVDEPDHKEVDLNECIENTLGIIENEIKDRATVSKHFTPLPPVYCSPHELNQVFMNIIMNASQAVDTEGIITITTGSIDNTVKIVVADNGCGIPQGSLSRIFEPFFTTRDVGQGTGLGLSICYDIVKNHGGDITVRSALGKGTEFTLTLPAKKEKGHG